MPISPARVVSGPGKPGGYVFRGPLGSTLPTDASTSLDAGLVGQGAVSNDGLTRAIEKAYETIRDWRGEEVARYRTENSVTANFSLIEANNGAVIQTIFGDGAVTIVDPTTEAAGTIAIAYGGVEPASSVWVFDMADGDALRRFVAPNAKMVTESQEQTFAVNAPIMFPVELTLFKDDSGNFFYEYASDGILASS